MNASLTAFLLDRIAEDEAMAREAQALAGTPWRATYGRQVEEVRDGYLVTPEDEHSYSDDPSDNVALHIAPSRPRPGPGRVRGQAGDDLARGRDRRARHVHGLEAPRRGLRRPPVLRPGLGGVVMDEPRKTLPINQENLDAIARSMKRASEDARRIMEASVPRIAAALANMSKHLPK